MNTYLTLKRMLHDRKFLSLVVSIALPVALQRLLSYLTNFLDTAMIGQLGAASISAVGLSSQYYTVCTYLVSGFQTGTGILLSQYFGSKDLGGIRRTMGLGLLAALLGSLLFTCGALFAPEQVMSFYTSSPEAIRLGSLYLRKIALSYPLYAACCIFGSVFCSTRKANYPVIASVVSVAVNLFLNYCLIFGRFGFPELGIEGAAIATSLSRLAELLALVVPGMKKSEVFQGRLSDFFGWELSFIQKYIRLAVPVIMMELIYAIGINLYYAAYGRLGDAAVASLTIAESIRKFTFVAGTGLFSATGVLVGNELGAGHTEKAQDYAENMLTLALLSGFCADLLMLLIMNPLLTLFTVERGVRTDAASILLIELVITVLKYYYGTIIVGILPAGGDTRANFLIDVGTVWLIGVPLVFLGAIALKLPVCQLYALAGVEHLVKTGLCLWRYRQKKWVRNLTA